MKKPKGTETVWVLPPNGYRPVLGEHLAYFDRRLRCERLGTVVEIDKDRIRLEFGA